MHVNEKASLCMWIESHVLYEFVVDALHLYLIIGFKSVIILERENWEPWYLYIWYTIRTRAELLTWRTLIIEFALLGTTRVEVHRMIEINKRVNHLAK